MQNQTKPQVKLADLTDINTDNIDATYSVEDNKLRLYSLYRLDEDTYQVVRSYGFKWAPKQELFVAPRWTPQREDLCLALAGEITAESTTMLDRAEQKSERLRQIALKREMQGNAYMDRASEISRRFEFGQPILVGHHSERRARKDKERMNNSQQKAVEAFKAVPYWHYRAEGVEHHANRKNRPDVRQRRIKTLLKEMRDFQRTKNKAAVLLKTWEKLETKEQIEFRAGFTDGLFINNEYDKLKNGEISHGDYKEKMISRCKAVIESKNRQRHISHTLNRLSYETSMLGDVERYEDPLTPVIIQTFARTMGAEKPKAKKTEDGFELSSTVDLPLHMKSTEGALKLTDAEWKDLMQGSGYVVPVVKRRKTTSKKAKISLINLSLKDAEKLQKYWNIQMSRKVFNQSRTIGKSAEVKQISQERYSTNSKGTYSRLKTIELKSDGLPCEKSYRTGVGVYNGEPVCRIRIHTGNYDFNKPNEICHITDKLAKPLPIDWEYIEEFIKPNEIDQRIQDDIEKKLKIRAEREAKYAARKAAS